MNTEYVKLTESARKLSMHADTVRYWVKLLDVVTIKQGHTCYVTAETLGVLAVMARLVGRGVPAGEAAAGRKTKRRRKRPCWQSGPAELSGGRGAEGAGFRGSNR